MPPAAGAGAAAKDTHQPELNLTRHHVNQGCGGFSAGPRCPQLKTHRNPKALPDILAEHPYQVTLHLMHQAMSDFERTPIMAALERGVLLITGHLGDGTPACRAPEVRSTCHGTELQSLLAAPALGFPPAGCLRCVTTNTRSMQPSTHPQILH